jgi:hypothetical protein
MACYQENLAIFVIILRRRVVRVPSRYIWRLSQKPGRFLSVAIFSFKLAVGARPL